MRNQLKFHTHEDISLQPYGHDRSDFNGIKLAHVAVHNSLNRNAGDTLLPQTVRRVFDTVAGSFGWELWQVWDEFTESRVERLNQTVNGLIIGGGGMIFRGQQGGDTANSGWAWNISQANLEQLNKPLVLFAIGYNRFRGQPDFDQHFNRHFTKTLEKCLFVGMRNSGSIREVSRYLEDPSLIEKLRLQFCPTTVCWQIFPEAAQWAITYDADKTRQPILAFNFAYDRPAMRFGDREDAILKNLAQVIKRIEQYGWKIVLTAHKVIDRAIETYLDGAGVSYSTHDLTEATYIEVMHHYAQCDLAIGMRGHGQMIPFGLRRPIISLISHNKVGYFLEDIDHPEWGVEIGELDMAEQLWEKFVEYGARNPDKTRRKVATAQENIWQLTRNNVAWIAKQLRTHTD